MKATSVLSLAVGWVLGAGSAGCGGAVDPGMGGGGGGGSSSGDTGSSSGSASSSGSSSGLSSGSSSSSGGPTSPECTGLALPTIAMICPDGSAAAPYYLWNGSQCVIAYDCSGSTSSSSSGMSGSTTGSSSGIVEPPPPVCDFALPDICVPCANGETVCAHYAIQNGTCVVETCPPEVGPIGGTCAQGAACSPNSGCGTAGDGNGCSINCTCDYTGTYQCTNSCAGISPPACATGLACSPGDSCLNGPDTNGCYTNCSCASANDSYSCTYDCGFGVAEDAGAAMDASFVHP